jgi:cytochrome c553
MRKTITFIAVVLAVLALAAGVAAQSPPRAAAPPTVIVVTARPTAAIDGSSLFEAYCTSCHGWSGRGNGPAAPALSTPVPDLSQYAQTRELNGDQCLRRVMAVLQYGHGHKKTQQMTEADLDMPDWGPIFRSISTEPGLAYVRMHNVAAYVVMLQAK